MEYDRIIIELLDRIQVLEQKVKALESDSSNKTTELVSENINNKKVSVKYRSLAKYLLDTNANEVSLSYKDIENILGFELPSSAHEHMHSFWANTYTHSYATSWLSVGYKTKVDIETKKISFIKNII